MKYLGPTPLSSGIAACGSKHCNGCYDVGDGRKIHPPRPSAKFLAIPGGQEQRPALKIKKKKKPVAQKRLTGL